MKKEGFVPHEQLTKDNFRDEILAVAKVELGRYGNPWAYLNAFYGAESDSFTQDLKDYFPRDGGLQYHNGHVLPPRETTFRLSLWDLSWKAESSTKPPPFLCTTMSLMDVILTDCFQTSTQPLTLHEGPQRDTSQQWVHYVKGACRSATALVLASLAIRYQWDLPALSPCLQASLCTIHAQNAACGSDAAAVALENARQSHAGAIRRAHCALTWLGKLILLRQKGMEPTSILKTWNSVCAREAQLKGQKEQALKALLSLPSDAVNFLLQHVSQFGGDSAFSETCWSNKRVMPGGSPKGYAKQWNARLTVTPAGFLLMLRYIHSRRERKLEGTRTKLSNAEMDAACLLCQFLVSLVEELEEQLPVQPHVIEKQLFQQLLDGDMNLELELQGALSEKKTDFNPGDLPALKKIIAQHVAGAEAALEKLGKTPASAIQPSQIERQAFDLAISAMNHDVDFFKLWLSKSRDRDGAIYHQDLSWKLSRRNRTKEYADHVTSRSSESWAMDLVCLESAAQGLKACQDVLKHISRIEHVAPDQIQVLCLLNWAAPALFNADQQRRQASLMGGLVNSASSPCVGVALMPIFHSQRGKLRTVEEKCFQLLASMTQCCHSKAAMMTASADRLCKFLGSACQ